MAVHIARQRRAKKKHGVTRLLQIDNESQKNSLHVCCVPKSGAVSLIPPKIQGVATQFWMSACGAIQNFMKNTR
jgi:hypothetical protein